MSLEDNTPEIDIEETQDRTEETEVIPVDPNYVPKYTEADFDFLASTMYEKAQQEISSQLEKVQAVIPPSAEVEEDKPLTKKQFEALRKQEQDAYLAEQQQQIYNAGLTHHAQNLPNLLNKLGLTTERDRDHVEAKFDQFLNHSLSKFGQGKLGEAAKDAISSHLAWMQVTFGKNVTDSQGKLEHSKTGGKGIERANTQPKSVDVKSLSLVEQLKVLNGKK